MSINKQILFCTALIRDILASTIFDFVTCLGYVYFYSSLFS